MKAAAALVVAALLLAAAFVMMDITGGPFEDTSGTVKSVATATPAGDNGPAKEMASVVLGNGRLVLATVPKAVSVRPGEAVELRIHRGVISGTSTYEVLGPKEMATK
jgi:hypothetical protein